MSNPDSLAAAQFWHRRATLLTSKLNFHHWLSRFIPFLFTLLILLALFELFRRGVMLPERWMESFFLMGVALASGWAWLRARKHFCNHEQALVRLETVLVLHNRLSAAREGIVPWPRPSADVHDGYARNWKRVLLPLLAGSLFLWSAHIVPVGRVKLGTATGTIAEPPAFAQVQSWINALNAEDLVQPDKLQEIQAALDKLRDRPPQDWYTQSNLEAADSLKEMAEQSMNSLSQDLQQADQAVQAMKDKEESSTNPGGLQAMEDELRKAGDNLASGNLPLNPELVDQLRGGEAGSDESLTAAQLEALHERLEKGELAAQTGPKSNGVLSEEAQEAMAEAAAGQAGGRHAVLPGSGGLGGGEETAPLDLQARDATTPQGPLTSVKNDDMSRVALGETLKISTGQHTVDPTAYHGPENAGAAQVEGSGGQAVWRSTYDPQEADALSRFFK